VSRHKPREGREDAARISELEDEAARCDSYRRRASAYQIAAVRIEIIAEHLTGLDFNGYASVLEIANDVDAFAGAIHALAKIAQQENEV
jgi:hypothetical protein